MLIHFFCSLWEKNRISKTHLELTDPHLMFQDITNQSAHTHTNTHLNTQFFVGLNLCYCEQHVSSEAEDTERKDVP